MQGCPPTEPLLEAAEAGSRDGSVTDIRSGIPTTPPFGFGIDYEMKYNPTNRGDIIQALRAHSGHDLMIPYGPTEALVITFTGVVQPNGYFDVATVSATSFANPDLAVAGLRRIVAAYCPDRTIFTFAEVPGTVGIRHTSEDALKQNVFMVRGNRLIHISTAMDPYDISPARDIAIAIDEAAGAAP